ncbi:MAG: hypothetical protein MJ107_08645 [Lachnospiraceae bacterium]|nr:hypothetical protein [Lachnospiraceae bacterium]
MGLFKTKYERQLDSLLGSLNMNMSNNYKDAARMDFDEFEKLFEELKARGVLKEKTIAAYESVLSVYKEKLKGYSHKDQKPYWH